MRLSLAVPILVCLASSAGAADLPPPPAPVTAEEFEKRRSVAAGAYVWAASLDGRVGIGRVGPVDVHADFADILENLDIAFMAVAEARYDRFGVFTDVVYSRISADGTGPRGFVDGSATSGTFIGTMMGEVRALEAGNSSVDVMAGARVWSVSNEIELTGPRGRTLSRSRDEAWVDPMIGAKGRLQGDAPFYATGWGMIGGFGASADIEWDVFGGLGYELNERVSFIAGYRALGVEYDRNDFRFDAIQHGPVVAGILHF